MDCTLSYSSLPEGIDYIDYVNIYNVILSILNDPKDTLEQHIEALKNQLIKLYPFAHLYIKICKQNPPIHAEIKEVCISWTNTPPLNASLNQ